MKSTTTLFALLISLGAIAQNWTELNGPFGGTISNFAFDDAGRSYCVTGFPIAGDVAAVGSGTAFVSTDAGGHWQPLNIPGTAVRDVATKGSTLYVFGSNQTTYTSADGGSTWVTKGTIPGQVATQLYGIKALPMANLVIVYGMDGMFISVDNGSTYTRFHAPFTTGWRMPSVQVASNGDIFVGEYTDGLLKYPFPANATVASSWTEAAWQNLIPTESIYQTDMDVAISPSDRIYVNIRSDANGARFLSSTDYGTTWQPLSNVGFTHTFNYSPHWAIAPNGRVFFIENASGTGYERTTYEFIEGAPTPWVKKAWPTSTITNQTVTVAAWRTNTQLFTGGVHDGVFISNNAAASFAPASTGIKLGKGYAVEVIPNGTGQRIVYIQGFMPQGYFYSDDDGANWTLRSSPFPGLGISELIKLPDNSLIVYAATDKDSPGYTYRSTDGINWDQSSVSLEFLDFHVVASNDIYGFTNGEGIYESIDHGETWDLIPVNGIPANGTILQGTRDSDGFLYINMPTSSPSDTEFWKIDTGVTPWQATAMTIPFEEGIANSVYNMFVLDNKVYINSSQNFVSSDHGVTWSELPISGILIPIKQGSGALGVAVDGKLSVTQDDGVSFRNIVVPTALIRGISMTSTGDFYAAGDMAPCLKYTEDLVLPADQQAPFVPYDWKPVKGPTGGAVAKILNGPAGSFYAVIPGTELMKLPAGSSTWVSTGPAIVNDAFVDQSATVFTATTTGIQKSTDGTNFSQLNYSKETYAIVRLSTGELIASGATGIIRSVDDGATFTTVSSIYPQQLITSPNGTVLARTSSEVFRSVNAGTTWTKCADTITGSVRSLGNLEGNAFSLGTTENNSYRSADDGATWTSIKGNLPFTSYLAPFALADGTYVVNSFSDLYTSTNNGGTWTKRSTGMSSVTSAVVSGSSLLFATGAGIVQSSDFGVTTTMVNSGIMGQRIQSLKMFRGKLMAIATDNTSQLVQSNDLGVTWSKVNGPVSVNRLLKVNDDLLIAYGSGIYKTVDGVSWTQVSDRPISKLATHNGSRYYATSFDATGLVYITSTDLVTWTAVPSAGLPASSDVLVAGANDTFYALDDGKLYRSSFGVNTTISFGADVEVYTLTTQNGKVQVLWANQVTGAQALIESVDGLTWTTLPSANGSRYIASDFNHRFMINESFAGIFIRVSRDGGVNWQNISSGSLHFDDIIVDEYTGLAFGFHFAPGPVYRTDKPILVDDKAAPLRVTISPGDDSQNVAIDTKLVITFNEAATAVGGKKIKVYVGVAVSPVFEVDVTAGAQANKTFTYTLPAPLAYLTSYYVVIDNGAFKDLFGNLYTGITDQTSWTFTTIETPDTQAPGIVVPGARNLEVGTGNKEIQFNVTDNKTIDISSAKFFYGAVTSSALPIAGALSATGSGSSVSFKATISESDYKSAGIAFYFEVADAWGNKSRYPATAGAFDYSYLTYPASQNPTLPALAAGGKKSNYKMISLPFTFASKNVSTLFAGLGPPAPDVWRLLTHGGGVSTNWLEYGDSDFSTIDRGVGYWINVKAPIEIKVPQASVPDNHAGNWFIMQLKPGWNQIGNPYTVPISWEQIRSSNTNIGKVKVFNPATLSYDNGDVLDKFGAGFVFLDGTAPIPVTIRFQGFTTGRMADPGFGTDLGSDTWQLPITLSQGTSISEFSGIGMHPEADNEKDRFDDLNPPPFLNLLEINFEHPQGSVKRLAMDVVPTTEDHRWNFNVSTDTEEEVRLQWDNTQMGNNSKELFLFNEENQSLIDMREQNSFAFKPVKGNRFRIYFGENLSDKVKPSKVLAGTPFPNPSNGITTIPFTVGDNYEHHNVTLDIVDILGRPVARIVEGEYKPGFYNVVWDAGDHSILNGFYIVRMTAESNEAREIQTRKIIVQK